MAKGYALGPEPVRGPGTGEGLIGHAGAVLLRKLADQCGLRAALRRGAGPEGEVPADRPRDGAGLNGGGDRAGGASMSDIALLAHQEPAFGARAVGYRGAADAGVG